MSANGSIICAVDDSASGKSVVMTALWLAQALGDRLIVVHAAPDADGEQETVSAVVAGWLEAVEHEMRILVDSAAPAILEEADDVAAGLIVTGPRGRGAFRSPLLGSVSRDVAAGAHCLVVVVPSATSDDDSVGDAEDVV